MCLGVSVFYVCMRVSVIILYSSLFVVYLVFIFVACLRPTGCRSIYSLLF
jgi:hypothetical protein